MEAGIPVAIFIVVTAVFLLARRRIELYLKKILQVYIKNKVGETRYNKYLKERVVFKRNGSYILSDEDEHSKVKEPTLYKTSISYGFIVLFALFIILGVVGVYFGRNEESFASRYITLLFVLYGVVMLIKYFTTKYILNENSLVVHLGIKKYIIPYKKIVGVEKSTINQLFKHGAVKGRIRAETNSKVFFIEFIDSNDKVRVIMISPKMQNQFAQHLVSKLKTT